jgi:nicotinamide mononucleotide transporter
VSVSEFNPEIPLNSTDQTLRESAVVASLLGAVGLIALAMALFGRAAWLEAFSFVTGAICVWLTVKQSIWNFPVGLANVATYCIVFFQSRLYADAGLQVVYFALGLAGWYLWLRGGENRSGMQVKRAGVLEVSILLVFVAVGTLGLWQMLQRVGGSASFWDALTTAISLASQWLLNRKRLENWIGWIVVDIIYVPLYAYKELYLTSILYALFLIMAIMGLCAWRESWLARRITLSDEPLTPAEVP